MNICVASAGGLAQVELIPEEKEFLGGARIFLDYNNMEDTHTLPEQKLGFPPVSSIPVDPKDSRILQNNNFQRICNNFHRIGVYSDQYLACVRNLRDELRKPINFQNNAGVQISGRIVNQDGDTGTTEGQRLINKIAKRLGDDLDCVLSRNPNRSIEKVICSTATWLFGAATLEIYNYLRGKLETEIIIDSDLVEAVGRCFKDNNDNDFALFYKAAVKQDCSKMYWMRAIWRILSLREYAPDIMERAPCGKIC